MISAAKLPLKAIQECPRLFVDMILPFSIFMSHCFTFQKYFPSPEARQHISDIEARGKGTKIGEKPTLICTIKNWLEKYIPVLEKCPKALRNAIAIGNERSDHNDTSLQIRWL